jgi:hypothetical protein
LQSSVVASTLQTQFTKIGGSLVLINLNCGFLDTSAMFTNLLVNFTAAANYFNSSRTIQASSQKISSGLFGDYLSNLPRTKLNKKRKKVGGGSLSKLTFIKNKVFELKKKLESLKISLISLKKLKQKYFGLIKILLGGEKLNYKTQIYKKKITPITNNIIIVGKSIKFLKGQMRLLVFHFRKLQFASRKQKLFGGFSQLKKKVVCRKLDILKLKQQFKNLNFYRSNNLSKKTSTSGSYLAWLRSTCFWPTRFGFLKLFLRRHKLVAQPKIRKAKYIKRMSIYKTLVATTVTFHDKKRKILEKWAKCLKNSLNGVHNSSLKKPKNLTKGFIELF